MASRKATLIPAQATHPGVLIKDEIAAIPDMSQKSLAKELGVRPSFLNEVIKGKRPVTADLAVLLEKALGISADYWMRFQLQYEIDKARAKQKNIEKIRNIEIWSIVKEYVPVRYFKKQGYFVDELSADIKTIQEIYNVETVNDLVSLFSKEKYAYYRKSDKLKIDTRNMFAWTSLAQYEAKKQRVDTFNFEKLPSLRVQLNQLFYENSNTIGRVQSLMGQFGIKLLFIDKLEKTPVDGFSFWSDENPAIALTLRYDRVDNFAFTIMHEIGHIDLHLRNDRDRKFMDFTNKQKIDQCEEEADDYARESLISTHDWQDVLEDLMPFDEDQIIAFGNRRKIHPAIVLGRICYEKDYYGVKTTIDRKLK